VKSLRNVLVPLSLTNGTLSGRGHMLGIVSIIVFLRKRKNTSGAWGGPALQKRKEQEDRAVSRRAGRTSHAAEISTLRVDPASPGPRARKVLARRARYRRYTAGLYRTRNVSWQ
jgi:hypothetical protein